MKCLVDADVLREPTKPSPDPRVVAWLHAHEPEIAVDPVILGELRFGILVLPRGKKRMALERWFNAVAFGFAVLLVLPLLSPLIFLLSPVPCHLWPEVNDCMLCMEKMR